MSRTNSIKSLFRNEIIAQLEDKNLKNDRKYILEMLLIAVNGLYELGIYIFPNIIELFQINGFKSSSLYINVILYITEKITYELNGNLKWINNRALKKGNKNDKNIIICFLLFAYRDNFIKFLQDYLTKSNQSNEKIKNLILNLQKIVGIPPENNSDKYIIPKCQDQVLDSEIVDITSLEKCFPDNFGENNEYTYDFKENNEFTEIEIYDFQLDVFSCL